MGVTMEIKGLEALRQSFESLPQVIQSGAKVGEPGIGYWMIWEWGRISCKPGPKTCWAVNFAGDTVVLTLQAPKGYIRVHKDEFNQLLMDRVSQVKLKDLPMAGWKDALTVAMDDVAQQCTDIIRDSAPVDTGDLRSSFEPAYSTDGLLQEPEGGAYGSTWLDLGNEEFSI